MPVRIPATNRLAILRPEPQDEVQTLAVLYPMLPSVNDLLLLSEVESLCTQFARNSVVVAARSALEALRHEIASGLHTQVTLQNAVSSLPDQIARNLTTAAAYSLRAVINATGVILHTNLGRAPLSDAAVDHMAEIARNYCNLELDLETGERSRRDIHVEGLLLRVLVGEGGSFHGLNAVVVNNCAAATFIALNSLANKREVLVSRGELVEIGGGFRIPDILEKSGAILKEIGATNRTRIRDYERALSGDTALILRVHRSNFSIEGFTETPDLQELVALSRRTGTPLFHDQGTGLISSLQPYGIAGEPTLPESIRQGVDLVAASGDKLIGGPQCGILVGANLLIERIRTNPLYRAFRVDKLTYAALEATLLEHLSGALDPAPVKRMLGIPPEELMQRCKHIAGQIASNRISAEIVPVASLVGGGTAPKATLPGFALSLRHTAMNATRLAEKLREQNPPVIARVCDQAVLLDLRTVQPRFDPELTSLINAL